MAAEFNVCQWSRLSVGKEEKKIKNEGNTAMKQKFILSLDKILGPGQYKQASTSNSTELLFISGTKSDI